MVDFALDVRNATLLNSNNKVIFDSLTFSVPSSTSSIIYSKRTRSLSSLLNCIYGSKDLSSGLIKVSANISWPIAAIPSLPLSLSPKELSRFLLGVYDFQGDHSCSIEIVQNYSRLSSTEWQEPTKLLPSFLQKNFLLAMSLVIPFDLYLVDPYLLNYIFKDSFLREHWSPILDEFFSVNFFLALSCNFWDLSCFCNNYIVIDPVSIPDNITPNDIIAETTDTLD